MTDSRAGDFVDHVRQAAADALAFVEALDKPAFLADKLSWPTGAPSVRW